MKTKSKKLKSKKSKKSTKNKTKKSKKIKKARRTPASSQVIYIQERDRPFRRVAGEQAIGGAAAGFGIAAGHSFGDWLFD